MTEKVEECTTMLDFFLFFINASILNLIVDKTNQRIKQNARKLTIDELKCWIGLLLLFGLTGRNDVEADCIWSSGPDQVFHSKHATAAMSRNRFKFLSSNICFYHGTKEQKKADFIRF